MMHYKCMIHYMLHHDTLCTISIQISIQMKDGVIIRIVNEECDKTDYMHRREL